MSFMKPQIVYGDWTKLEDGWYPSEHVGDMRSYGIHSTKGFGARLSALGYMDCTDWTVFNTKEKARNHLRDKYCECDTNNNDGLCELCQSLMDMD